MSWLVLAGPKLLPLLTLLDDDDDIDEEEEDEVNDEEEDDDDELDDPVWELLKVVIVDTEPRVAK